MSVRKSSSVLCVWVGSVMRPFASEQHAFILMSFANPPHKIPMLFPKFTPKPPFAKPPFDYLSKLPRATARRCERLRVAARLRAPALHFL